MSDTLYLYKCQRCGTERHGLLDKGDYAWNCPKCGFPGESEGHSIGYWLGKFAAEDAVERGLEKWMKRCKYES